MATVVQVVSFPGGPDNPPDPVIGLFTVSLERNPVIFGSFNNIFVSKKGSFFLLFFC